jgi:hypothetical protein
MVPVGVRNQTQKIEQKEITMKRLAKTLFAFGFTYAITATSLFAQQVYTFDEFGNSSGPASAPPSRPGFSS